MENGIIKDYMVYNGNTVSVKDFEYDRTRKFPGVYEVIRIIDGVPLFVEKHISRFKSSAKLLGFEIQVTDAVLIEHIRKLIDSNKCNAGNVKIIINNLDKPVQDNYLFFIKSKYPTSTDIENGVPTILFYGERNNPNAKTTDLSLREKINLEISKNNVYEALLVNRDNEITEGSRSNVFFVKNDKLFTSPAKDVLPGVTRGCIMDICTDLRYEVSEKTVNVDSLGEIDGLFITGTSPQVLPISYVDDIKYSSSTNLIINEIRKAYENLVKDYINLHK